MEEVVGRSCGRGAVFSAGQRNTQLRGAPGDGEARMEDHRTTSRSCDVCF